jgi:hypothetical protein
MVDSAPSKIQYDDFIASVQPDPAKPESTIMLSGFVGHGGDGVVRIYPDPSLGTWYDVPEADVVHSMAVPDSKLGGSYVWVRAAADIKPGSTSTSSAATGSGSGGPAVAAAAAAPAAHAAPNFTIGAGCTFICAQPPGGLLQPTPATHCFICPSITQQCMQPTPTADVTLATICTQPNHCLQPTPTVHPSLATVCTQFCPTFHTGCLTVPVNCFPVTQPAVCTIAISPNCPPPPPGTPVQQQALAAAVMRLQPTPTVQTHCFVCPPHQTLDTLCTLPPGCPITQQCSAVNFCSPLNQCGNHPTAATICTETCNTMLVGCWQTLPAHCFPITQPQVCNIAVSPNCPPPAPGTPVQQQQVFAAAAMQPTPSAVNQCGVHTAATICTQPPACHPSVNVICPAPSAVHQCGPNTAATVCTQPPACHPSVNVICPTPSAVHQCGGAQMAAAGPVQAAAPTPNTNCFTCPGFTNFCTQVPGTCQPTQNFGCTQGCVVFTPYGR